MAPLLPVTVLSGFLGAGKTTLLKKILSTVDEGKEQLKVAVIVNDMGEINLDAEEIKNTKLIQEEAQMVELHNGCICCTLRGDLLKTVKALSEEKSFDYLVIESTGISEPLPVAQTFVMNVDGAVAQQQQHEHGHQHGAPSQFEALSKFARLDTMVTVVDALNVFDVLGSIETLAQQNMTGMVGNTGVKKDKPAPNEVVDERNITQLMLDQIEFANVIIVSKAPLFKKPELLPKVTGLLQRLNPGAKILVPKELHFADLSLSEVLNTNLFDMEASQNSAGWLQELQKSMTGRGHTPETEEYGISSVLFKCHSRPFHAQRLREILRGFGNYAKIAGIDTSEDDPMEDDATAQGVKVHSKSGPFEGVVRAKGRLWIATACSYPINIQISGRHLGLVPTQPFLHAVMTHLWPNDNWDEFEHFSEFKTQGVWFEDSGYGDSMSEAVFIGIHLNKEKIVKALEAALLTDEELAGGRAAWKKYQDVFFGGKFFDVMPDEPGIQALKQIARRKVPAK